MQSNREKIVNILTTELSYCYCDNCRYSDDEQFEEGRYCMDCYRKYQNWALSPGTAEELADRIIKEVFNNVE